jgi:hypothetical protein
MLLFVLVAYSIVFTRMLYISCRLAFGRSSIKFAYGLAVSELSVFILFTLCLVITLFIDGGVVSTILL